MLIVGHNKGHKMESKINSDFKCITRKNPIIKIDKKKIIEIFKNEFKSCIEDESLDCTITYTKDPIAKFEFIKKEK